MASSCKQITRLALIDEPQISQKLIGSTNNEEDRGLRVLIVKFSTLSTGDDESHFVMEQEIFLRLKNS